MSSAAVQYGPTKPLQPPEPTPRDIVESARLMQCSTQYAVPDCTARVLEYVTSVGAVMVKLCQLKLTQAAAANGDPAADGAHGSKKPPSPETLSGAWVKAFAFGSSGLDANVSSSDVDVYVGRVPLHAPAHTIPSTPLLDSMHSDLATIFLFAFVSLFWWPAGSVLVCPINITAATFLNTFPTILRQRNVGDVVVVSATRVPVVKFHLGDVAVDVVFVSFASECAPSDDDMLPLAVFQRISKETRQSIQGLRTILEVRRRIPVPMDVYSATLKAVKYWAMRRRIYGNNYCFPAGVSLAVMVARVCQVFPASHPSVLVRFFFLFYRQWLAKRGQASPIFITEQIKPDNLGRIFGMWDSWDPNRDGAKDELMVVLNPAYPHNNTSYNVGRSGLEHFYRELVRTHSQLQSTPVVDSWEDVWPEYCIGDDFSQFLVLEVPQTTLLTNPQEKMGWESWSLLLESKLKILLYSLETWLDVRMWPKRLANAPRSQYGCAWAIGLRERDHPSPPAAPTANGLYPAAMLSKLDATIEEFQLAVEESMGRGFVRSVEVMRSPVCYLMSHGDAAFPVELLPSQTDTNTATIAMRGLDKKRPRDE